MSQSREYKWPVLVGNGISLSQAPVANTPLALNGPNVNKTTGTVRCVDDFGIVPRINFSSASNLSSVNFTIIGYQNGVFISEILAGPNANIVTSVNCFDSIEKIIPSTSSANNILVGFSNRGYYPIIPLNMLRSGASTFSLNTIAAAENPLTYQGFISLKNFIGLGKYDDLSTAPTAGGTGTGDFASLIGSRTASFFAQYNNIGANLLFKIGTTATGANPVRVQFLQV